MLRKHNQIIGKVKFIYLVCTHTFEVNITNYVAEAKSFDEDNGNILLWNAVCRETKSFSQEFETGGGGGGGHFRYTTWIT